MECKFRAGGDVGHLLLYDIDATNENAGTLYMNDENLVFGLYGTTAVSRCGERLAFGCGMSWTQHMTRSIGICRRIGTCAHENKPNVSFVVFVEDIT